MTDLRNQFIRSLAQDRAHLRLVDNAFEEEIEASLEAVRSVIGDLEKVEAKLLKVRSELQRTSA